MTLAGHRIASTVLTAALGAGVLVFTVPASPAPEQTCPPGQVEDTATPGFQCVLGCPWGTLLDGVSHSCVEAPGVPPPPLQ
ncbi:MAG: hypothetical protein ACR2JM_05795 [Mycobacterium sp.]